MNGISEEVLQIITAPDVIQKKVNSYDKGLAGLAKYRKENKGKPDIVNELIFEYVKEEFATTEFFKRTLTPLFEHFITVAEDKIKARIIKIGATKVSLRRNLHILNLTLKEFGKPNCKHKAEGYNTEIEIIYNGLKTQVRLDWLLRESISYLQFKKTIESFDSVDDNNKYSTRLLWKGESVLGGV